ncbi:MAG TPA: NADH-quinone oxidoreductase subunit L [Verrucomicrobiae bacterium]|nr:NADH-quinone oxidoreductase subunit L [Verrucomicrobiae bacterium]
MELKLLWIIQLAPLAAFFLIQLLPPSGKKTAPAIAVAFAALAAASSLALFAHHADGRALPAEYSRLWLQVTDTHALSIGFLVDKLNLLMISLVTVIAAFVHIFSYYYMAEDPSRARYFGFLSFFAFAMTGLVLSSNLLQTFLFWELVGLASYLLIGFWYEKTSAATAARKAFVINRLADLGFYLGIILLFLFFGTVDFLKLDAEALRAQFPAFAAAGLGLLVFTGVMGKSAQFPFHNWLPDAMEGPTPVSALIHAATMVAAGVYLVARSFVLLEVFPQVMPVIAVIGTITAFMAAFIALTATDIKKVLAYSTISQLGFMVTAMGLGSMTAGLFHLMTHAFFKALLFLGAGSVIHGTGTQDIREMGGLFGKMKSTAFTFLIASLAIAGVPPLAGFWSKDEILLAAHDSGNQIIYIVLGVTAFMTAFYMFRLFILTFLGKPRNSHIHAHESPVSMTGPLWVLALGSIVIGLPGSPFLGHWFQNFLEGGHAEAHVNMTVMISSIAIGLGGIILAAIIYGGGLGLAEKLAKAFGPLYTASVNKLWFDELYAAFIVKPFQALGGLLFKFDAGVIDGIVNGVGRLTMKKSALSGLFDKYVVDGLVNLVGYTTQLFSSVLRKIQSGLVQNYLLILFSGLVILLYLGAR